MIIHQDDIVIVGAKRTAIGAFQGQFKGLSSPRLASVAIEAALKQAGIDPATIDEAISDAVCLPVLGRRRRVRRYRAQAWRIRFRQRLSTRCAAPA